MGTAINQHDTARVPSTATRRRGRLQMILILMLTVGPMVLATGMGPEKHTAYAVQWFAMALALVGLYLYLGWHTAQEKRHGNGHQSA